MGQNLDCVRPYVSRVARLGIPWIVAVLIVGGSFAFSFTTLAAWEGPEGAPYTPSEQGVLYAQEMERHSLLFRDGLMVWIERPWIEEEVGYSYPGQVRAARPFDSPEAPMNLTELGRGVVTNGRHMAWIELDEQQFNNGTYYGGAADAIVVQDTTTGEEWRWTAGGFHAWTRLQMDSSRLAWHDGYTTYIHELSSDGPTSEGPNITFVSPGFYGRDPQPIGRWIIYAGHPDEGVLHAWDPDTDEVRTYQGHTVVDIEDGRVLARLNHGGGKPHTLVLIDLEQDTQRPLTFSPGQKYYPEMSGDWVSWVDARFPGTRTPQGNISPEYDLYFMNIYTLNEYKMEVDFLYRNGGAAMDAGRMVYPASDHTLRWAQLPTQEDLLIATVQSIIEPPMDDDGFETNVLDVSLEAPGIVSQYWDRNLDGTFDSSGPLRLNVDAETNTPDLKSAFGIAVDKQGRTAAIAINVTQILTDALDHDARSVQGPEIRMEPSSPRLGQTVDLKAIFPWIDAHVTSASWYMNGTFFATGPEVRFTFDTGGPHSVLLRVETKDGLVVEAALLVDVLPAEPEDSATQEPSATMADDSMTDDGEESKGQQTSDAGWGGLGTRQGDGLDPAPLRDATSAGSQGTEHTESAGDGSHHSVATAPGFTLGAAAMGVGIAATGSGIMLGRQGWFRWIPLSFLFTRLAKSKLLDHPLRSEFFAMISAHPGIHFNELVRRCGRGQGTVEHHLDKLVGAGLVRKRVGAGYVCFYPASCDSDMRLVGAHAVLKSKGARDVLTAVARTGCWSSRQIANMVTLSPTTVSHHVRRLEEYGLICRDRGERGVGYRITDLGVKAAASLDT